jgi:NMD protein affecting ribosome stability and mRNA decay
MWKKIGKRIMTEYCAECGNILKSQKVWQSTLTNEMVSDLSYQELSGLIEALDEAVMIVASGWGIGQ